MTFIFETCGNPDADEVDFIGQELTAFNDADVGPSQKRPLAVFIRDASGALAGGLAGNTGWGWLYIERLWLSEPARGRVWQANS